MTAICFVPFYVYEYRSKRVRNFALPAASGDPICQTISQHNFCSPTLYASAIPPGLSSTSRLCPGVHTPEAELHIREIDGYAHELSRRPGALSVCLTDNSPCLAFGNTRRITPNLSLFRQNIQISQLPSGRWF